MKKSVFNACLLACICLFAVLGVNKYSVQAAASHYGMLIGNASSKYTYYDLNGVSGTQKIEKASNGTIMIPVKKVCKKISVLSYHFDWNTMKATITNAKNGKKIILAKNSKYVITYSSKNAKAKKVKLAAKTYLSSGSNALMADVKALKYVFAKTTGYQCYQKATSAGKKALKNALYNSSDLRAIIVYNPYKAVTSLPKATAVSYVSEKDSSNIVKATIPEGYSVTQIAELMVKKGVCQSTSAFLKAVNEVNTSKYSFLSGIKTSSSRCFLLEGYLYPSTYEFYKNTSPADVIAKILRNTSVQYTDEQQERAKELGYTMDQVLAIASIIEKEVSIETEQANVASVLYNRLSSGMKLQCDATIHYVEKYIKPYISGDKDRFNEYYNTYKCTALPGGPICNPGKKAIQAALAPEMTDYYYFCSSIDGTYYYANSYEEHLKNAAHLE